MNRIITALAFGILLMSARPFSTEKYYISFKGSKQGQFKGRSNG